MKKSCIFAIVTVLLVSALFVSCSNGSDSPSVAGTPVAPTTDGTTTGTENGDGQTTTPTQTPEPIPATYTITFNAMMKPKIQLQQHKLLRRGRLKP